jgi:integrase
MYADGGNLYLQVTSGGASWVFRYKRDGRRTPRDMGLGPLHTIGLADARERARQCREMLIDGKDPLDERRAEREAMRVATITAKTKAMTWRRVRMRVETVIEWAIASKFFVGDNPAKRERLRHLLGKQGDTVKHHAAISYVELPAFVAELREFDGIGALPLEFNLLTATRTSETLLADWSEFDLANALWTIPGNRRKGQKGKENPLTVPLSERCMAILRQIGPQAAGFVFTGPSGQRLSENTLSDTMKQLGRSETVHGTARSSFRDWCGDQTNFPREIAEAALGHTIANEVEAAYRRGSALAKRRRLMTAWTDYLAKPAVEQIGKVMAIGVR